MYILNCQISFRNKESHSTGFFIVHTEPKGKIIVYIQNAQCPLNINCKFIFLVFFHM